MTPPPDAHPSDPASLARLPLRDLLALRNAIDQEIASRGHTRTAASLHGELMERVVADAYEGELTPPTRRSVDVVAGDGRAIQVKVRSLPRGSTRFWQFEDLDFDVAVVIAMDRDTAEIDWARELSAAQVAEVSTTHASGKLRLPMGRARSAGHDVTARLREAYAGLS